MQSLLMVNADADFLNKASRVLVETGHRFRARCDDPNKVLGLIGTCQKSDEPVNVLLASAPADDPRTMDFVRAVNEDFPEVALIVMKQSDSWEMSIEVFSARRNGQVGGPMVPLDAHALSYIVNGALARFADQGLRGRAVGELRARLQEYANSADFAERFLDEVLAFPLLNVGRGSIFLFDEPRDRMVLVAANTGNGLNLRGLTLKLGEGVAGYVAQEKKPLLVVSQGTAPIPLTSSRTRYATESFICAPILNSGRLIGVLNLTEKKSRMPFNEMDLDVVTDILGQFSANIEQAFQQSALRDEIRNLEEMIEVTQRKAGMGEMVEGVAHEINSALDGTMRFVKMALKKLKETSGDERACEWLNDARVGLERICRIVKPVNKYTRNGSKKFVRTDLTKLLNDVLGLMSHKLTKHNVLVVKQFKPELPTISARSDLDQVSFNLLTNAIEAMQTGGTLEVLTDFDEKEVFIRFKDTGCGIPAEMLSKIGEPYFTTKEEGTGLGLSICQKIISEHDGELEVESEVGVGSTFTVRLPLGQQKKGD